MTVLPGFFLPRTEANEYMIALSEALKEDDMQEEPAFVPTVGDVIVWKHWTGWQMTGVVKLVSGEKDHFLATIQDPHRVLEGVGYDQIVSVNGIERKEQHGE